MHQIFKCTDYFHRTRQRRDRLGIRDEWIIRAIHAPEAQATQRDGRVRHWMYIEEEQRHLRLVLLADGETVHNACFDRRFHR